jgi:hypothetical protein
VALATATTLPMTATDEDILILVGDLARIARSLGELTAAARDRWADWGTVTPHLQAAEALAADTTRCLSHAAGIYAFNSVSVVVRLGARGELRRACPEAVVRPACEWVRSHRAGYRRCGRSRCTSGDCR